MKLLVYLALFVFSFLVLYKGYFALVNHEIDGDSRDYHIPVAEHILDGTIFSLPDGLNSAMYYPASSEAILSLFMLLGIPIRLYGWIAWLLLFYLCYKLAIHFMLERKMALVFAVGFSSVQSVLRQTYTQSIDLWMAIFFIAALLLLEKPKKTALYFVLLGLFLGMLLGSKATGLLYVVVLGVVYFRKIISFLTLKRVLAFLISFSVVGLPWYIRNWVLYQNPLYPANIPFFRGYPNFPLQDMMLWKTPFIYQDGLYKIVEAVLSEYLFLGFTVVISFVALIFIVLKKYLEKDTQIKKLSYIFLLLFLVSLLFPIPTISIISNMRYLFPLLIVSSLLTFLLAKRFGLQDMTAVIVVSGATLVFTQLEYYPKLFIIILAVQCGIFFFLRKKVKLMEGSNT
jgi:hypothetical protein